MLFTNDPLDGDMIGFLVDNIDVRYGGQLFLQTVGIPVGTNCAPSLPDFFLYSCQNEFFDKHIKDCKGKLAASLISHIVILMTLSLSTIKG